MLKTCLRSVFLKPRVATQEPGRHEVTTGSRRLWKMGTSDIIMKFFNGKNGFWVSYWVALRLVLGRAGVPGRAGSRRGNFSFAPRPPPSPPSGRELLTTTTPPRSHWVAACLEFFLPGRHEKSLRTTAMQYHGLISGPLVPDDCIVSALYSGSGA